MSTSQETPEISVLLSVHDGAPYIAQAVDSLLNQSEQHLEVIAIDDGSTDGSGEILERYAVLDTRVRVFRRTHVGLTVSLNAGLQAAQGRYFARLDADDIALPGRLAAQREYLECNPEIALVGSDAVLIDTEGHEFGRTQVGAASHEALADRLLHMDAFFPHSSWLVRRDVMKNLGGYDEFYRKAQDYDFLLRCIERYRIACLPARLVGLRKTIGSASYDTQFLQYRYAVVALVSHLARTRKLSLAPVSQQALFDAVSRWFSESGLRDCMLSQLHASFAVYALRAGTFLDALRYLREAFKTDSLFALRRGSLTRRRRYPLPSLTPYLR